MPGCRCLGREHDLGVTVNRHQPGMAARLVLKQLGEDVTGKGKGKSRGSDGSCHSPKRESEGGVPEAGRRRKER